MVNAKSGNNEIRVSVRSGDETNTIYPKGSTTQAWANEARDWAIKTDDTVDGQEYSAKHYALSAKNAVNGFDVHVQEKTNVFNTNANTQLDEFNTNATEKLTEYNTNASEKQALINEKANETKTYADTATAQASNALISANNAEISATLASDKANIATNKADEASISAITAADKAIEASNYSNNASTSANNASIQATSAISSASSASASATTATNKANEAQQFAQQAEYWAEQASEGQLQSDWNQADNTKKDFIKNKPDLSTKQDKLTPGTGIDITNNVISNTQTSATWGSIEGTLSDQIDLQNALDGKLNVGMDNLSDNGYAKLESQKAYLTGNVLTDSKGYNEVLNASTSTFDLSKFEVVGSPVISDDGVVIFPGSVENILISTGVQLGQLADKSFSLTGAGFYTSLINENNCYPLGINSYGGDLGFRINTTYIDFYVTILKDDGTTTQNYKIRYTYENKDDYLVPRVKFNITSGEYSFYIDKGNGFELVDSVIPTQINKQEQLIATQPTKTLDVRCSTATISTQKLNLKTVEVVIDGQTIFSGTKTGLDVIKPDNYEVVGSPTISENGVLSYPVDNPVASTLTNCVQLNDITLSMLEDKDFKFTIPFTLPSQAPVNRATLYSFGLPADAWTSWCGSPFIFNGKIKLEASFGVTGSHHTITLIPETLISELGLNWGSSYYYSLERIGNNYVFTIKDNNTILWTQSVTPTSENKNLRSICMSPTENINIGQGQQNDTNVYSWAGDIDLNGIQLEIEGSLVYQPCLKIPYTLSKTGSKIVDVSARNRVQDVYEQYGEALYYTLDEENQNYTIPMGEVYGMIESASKPERNIGEIITSTIPLNDEGLHLADGALLQQGGVYGNFVEYIGSLVATNPGLFVTEEEWQTAVTNYGVCGKYVYDPTAKTLRLPKIDGFIEGTNTIADVGNLTEAGLPNITGEFNSGNSNISTGAFVDLGAYNTFSGGNNSSFRKTGLDASRSSAVYGNSTTVQPQTTKVLYYIVVANAKNNQIYVTPQNIISDVNAKADTDLSNVPASKGILVESYQNGTSWYRLYSDGWSEQGFIYTRGSNATTNVTVSLLKGLIDTNYIVLLQREDGNNTYALTVQNKTLSGFDIICGNQSAFNKVAIVVYGKY